MFPMDASSFLLLAFLPVNSDWKNWQQPTAVNHLVFGKSCIGTWLDSDRTGKDLEQDDGRKHKDSEENVMRDWRRNRSRI